MFQRILLVIPLLMLATAVLGQTTSSMKSDSWPAAAASSTTAPEVRTLASPKAVEGKSHFTFKQGSSSSWMGKPAPTANDKEVVMGQQRPWQDGRPPVDCAITPHDASCR